jgi:hypothetical protein
MMLRSSTYTEMMQNLEEDFLMKTHVQSSVGVTLLYKELTKSVVPHPS